MELRRFDYTLKSAFAANHVAVKTVFAHPRLDLWDTVMLKQKVHLTRKLARPLLTPKRLHFALWRPINYFRVHHAIPVVRSDYKKSHDLPQIGVKIKSQEKILSEIQNTYKH